MGSDTYYNEQLTCVGGLIGYLYTKDFPCVDGDSQLIKDLSTTNLISNCKTTQIKVVGENHSYVGGAIGYAYGEVANNEILNLRIKDIKSDTNNSISVEVKDVRSSSINPL